jgi:hypothetical protein
MEYLRFNFLYFIWLRWGEENYVLLRQKKYAIAYTELLYFSYFFLYKFYCNKNTISIVSFNLSEKYYSPVNSTNDYSPAVNSILITWFFFA